MGLAQWTDYPAYTSQYPNPLPWAAMRDGYNWYSGEYQCYLLTKATDPTYTDMGYGWNYSWYREFARQEASFIHPEYQKSATNWLVFYSR